MGGGGGGGRGNVIMRMETQQLPRNYPFSVVELYEGKVVKRRDFLDF